jgi:hypothetical protein
MGVEQVLVCRQRLLEKLLNKAFMFELLHVNPKDRPINRMRDDCWPKPTPWSLPALFFLHLSYAGVLVAGWNLDLPSKLELILWRIASLTQVGTICLAWLTMPLYIVEDKPTVESRFIWFIKSPFSIS